MAFVREPEPVISQRVWKSKTPGIATAVLRKKNGTAGISLPGFKLYYKATVTNTVWYWHKGRSISQWNKTESPEINIRTYGHLIFDKADQSVQWRKDNLFNKGRGENCSTTRKRMKLQHLLTPHTKNKLKMDRRSKHKTENYYTPRGKHRQNTL